MINLRRGGLSNFIEKFTLGEVGVEDLDNFIEEWHDSPTDLSLYDYLGLTWEQYSDIVRNPKLLLEYFPRTCDVERGE